MRIDMNCDMGECCTAGTESLEERIMPLVSSVNIACGVHGGDADTMRRIAAQALRSGCSIGAHPGFKDRDGSGRNELAIHPHAVTNLVAYQIGALIGILSLDGARLNHVKPHGALYTMAAKDRKLADAIVSAIVSIDHGLILYGSSKSELVKAGKEAGLTVAEEAFADRGYRSDGSLVPRSEPGALLQHDSTIRQRVHEIMTGTIMSCDKSPITIHADTICIHSDTPGALHIAELVRAELQSYGMEVGPVAT